jgi:hypothetical protein
MKTLCITGMPGPTLEMVHTCLEARGVKPALSAEHHAEIDIRMWHDNVVGDARNFEISKTLEHPGRLWEQIGGEIFVTNLQQKMWGWCDHRSVALLDYWAEFEPQVRFVLLCVKPEYQLARMLEDPQVTLRDMAEFAQHWLAYHQMMLEFYHRYPTRSVLVDAASATSIRNGDALEAKDEDTPFDLYAHIGRALGIPLDSSPHAQGAEPAEAPGPLAQYLAHNFLASQALLHTLWREIEATIPAEALSAPLSEAESGAISPDLVVENIRTLQDRSTELHKIATLQQHTHQREEQIATLQKQAQESADQLAQENKNVAQKNSALQQSQQQLDQQATQLQDRDKHIATLQKQAQESADQLAQEKKNVAQKEARFKELEQKNQEVTEENELILLQLHQVQEELERYFLQNQEAEQQLKSLKDEHKKTMHENEQRLYQMHEAQEELGLYLVKNQEQKKQLEKTEARWERLLKRMPDYCDYGEISIIQGNDASSLICEIQDLETGAQAYPELEFETFLFKGISGFRFTHPAHITQEDLIPVAQSSEEAKKQSALLKSLSTSEWLLLQSTAQLLKTYLQTEKFDEETLPASLIQATINGLGRFIEVISKIPETLRYDKVSFNEKVLSEDCEQLEICLENLSCGDLVCPSFIFRLSCAGLESSDFGSNPRLEFPEETSTLFKAWFDSSSNPDDPRLELRFALPEAMDLEVWNQLSEDDAGIIRMLTTHLPGLMEKTAPQPELDDGKWLAVAQDVEQILKRRTSEQEEMVA